MQKTIEDHALAKSNAHAAGKLIDRITQAFQSSKLIPAPLQEKISQLLTQWSEKSLLDEFLRKGFAFSIGEDLKSSATRVMFSNSNDVRQQICLKMWLECNNGVYDTGDLTKRTEYLLEGLEFNRRFASGICMGIVPIVTEIELEEKVIQCGPLIRKPNDLKLDFNKLYALVMKRLDRQWRLDQQLYAADELKNQQNMEFLASEIARMHQRLQVSPPDMGTPKQLSEKLQLNRQKFQEALDHVQKDPIHSDFRKRSGNEGMRWFRSVGWLLEQTSKVQQPNFEQRHNNGYIRRCHGDLKATNLWLCPANYSRSQAKAPEQRLVTLDCVDFRPEFCHIDTLSDVAMLAVDLEMRLTSWGKDSLAQQKGRDIARLFLNTYLQKMGEQDSVNLLLEYYMTEKAMVCAYMSILYDGLPSLGEKYLDVVFTHSQGLVDYLPSKIGKRITRITRPLALMTGATTLRG